MARPIKRRYGSSTGGKAVLTCRKWDYTGRMSGLYRRLQILGSSAVTPGYTLYSEEIDRLLRQPVEITERRTGVKSRPVCRNETQIDLASAAARLALEDAKMNPCEIELLIFASSVGYQAIPFTAALVQKAIGIPDGGCAAFDVNASCLSFLVAMDTATHMVAGGAYKTCLIVSAEMPSRAVSFELDPSVASLFGDGAAAVVFGNQAIDGGVVASLMEAYPSAYEDCGLLSGGTRFDPRHEEFLHNSLFKMDGRALFRHAAACFPNFVDRLLKKAKWTAEDVDLVIPHQASKAALVHLARRCGFSSEKIVDIIAERGNQVAASIPSALDAARRAGRLRAGTKTLLLGTSAGVAFGGMALVA